MRQGTSFDASVPYASCCRKGKRSSPSPLTFPIFSSLSTLCKITFTSTPMRLYERCKHASNDFTLAAVLIGNSAPNNITVTNNLYDKIAKGEKYVSILFYHQSKRWLMLLLVFQDTIRICLAFMEFQRSKIETNFINGVC